MTHELSAKTVIHEQAKALNLLADNLPKDFSRLVDYILQLKGRVILVGMGKSGYIARKISASLASTGTPAFYIHPAEASHGDLGMITHSDLVILLSNSGETKELFDTINYCKRFDIKVAAITMKKDSTLAKHADFLLNLPSQKESSDISAPTTSALMALSIGDALITTLHNIKGFTKHDFKIFHPGGKIGANLLKVSEIMHSGDQLPIIQADEVFANAIIAMNKKRLGCVAVIDKSENIIGIITDGDLRRHINDDISTLLAKDVMTPSPQTIEADSLIPEALFIMNDKSITVLPVLEKKKLIGIIHIHDILKSGAS